MNAVFSYSLTGNNEALAAALAKEFSAKHVKIAEEKPRRMGKIILDLMLARTPKTTPAPEELKQYGHVLFVGPVWMGKAAFPLRAYFKYIKANKLPYAFVSISGGSLNPNPKLADNLEKSAGTKPAAFIDLHITDLLPAEAKTDMKATAAYKLTEEDIAMFCNKAAEAVKGFMK